MSDAPVYWSQPNQQVVRDGDPVGIVPDEPPQTRASKTKTKKDDVDVEEKSAE